MKIAVIGAGKWGQALYSAFSKNNEVVITSRTPREIENFVSIEEALKYEYLIIALSAQYIRSWFAHNFLDMGQKILIASKGIERSSGSFLNEVLDDYISQDRLAFLGGPSFAYEVLQELPCALVIASENKKLSKKFQKALPNYIKGYTTKDVIGVEVSGSYKNVLAIASGICDGLELGNNARASLIARGLVEMSRFGKYFGAKNRTFLSLAGAGDLFLTASSTLSRNYRVGEALAKGKTLEQILQELGEVAEGVATTTALYKIAQDKHLYLPIALQVYEILNGKEPIVAVQELLN
jgi:glycerol-3-phosphate dehydrogenase (NAD(P)+)